MFTMAWLFWYISSHSSIVAANSLSFFFRSFSLFTVRLIKSSLNIGVGESEEEHDTLVYFAGYWREFLSRLMRKNQGNFLPTKLSFFS